MLDVQRLLKADEVVLPVRAHGQPRANLLKNPPVRVELVERAIPLPDVEVEEAMQVVDAHGIVLVHLRWPCDGRAGGAQPAAPGRGEARSGKNPAAMEPRPRDGGGSDTEAHERFRHGEWSGKGKRDRCAE